MALIRGTSLSGFPGLVADLGSDPVVLLRKHHIPPAAVADYESFVDYVGLLRLLEDAALQTEAEDFGLRLARRQGIEILGTVGAAALSAPTVSGALAIFERFLRAFSPASEVRVSEQPDRALATYEWRITLDGLPPHAQGTELALGVSLNVFRALLGTSWSPVMVHVPHEPRAPRRDYVDYFGAPVTFADSIAGFDVKAAELAGGLSQDQTIHRVLLAHLERITPAVNSGVSEAVSQVVRGLLPTGALDLDLVAARLALHRRTLQRKLAGEGTSFAAVVDQTRRRIAEAYLRDTDMTLAHLAHELGYGEQSVLTRASRRWFGISPMAYRKNARFINPRTN